MTYLEKYKLKNPGLSTKQLVDVVLNTCPHGDNGLAICCPPDLRYNGMKNEQRCPICWIREIPETEPTNNITDEREDGNMKKFTKDDLKVGYVVKFRKGDLRMIMPTARNTLVAIGPDGQNGDIYHYNNNLTSRVGPRLDIIEVYGYTTWDNEIYNISTDNRPLLWKREEKTCDSCAHKVVCTHVGMCEHYMEKETSK